MKKYISVFLCAFMFLAAPAVFAAEVTDAPLVTSETVAAPAAEPISATIDRTKSVEALRARGKALIAARIASLNAEGRRIDRSKLTADQKTELKKAITDKIAYINTLKEKILAEKDLATMKTLNKRIYEDFYIYAIAIPRLQGMRASYVQMSQASKLKDHWTKLDAKLMEWQGKADTTKARIHLDAAKKHLEEANMHYGESLSSFKVLDATDYPAKNVTLAARTHLKEGNTHLRFARTELQKAVVLMKMMEKTIGKKVTTIKAPVTAAQATAMTVTYSDTGFSPSMITVKAGTTVTFKNTSSGSMWVASDPHPAHTDLPGFDEKNAVAAGGTYQYTFTEKGTHGFHNHFHSSHTGTAIVE